MRIVSLEVQRFACVKLARVDFARGLNVLHGPNDIGKSTLVQAMRAALLLPHSSSAHKEFIPWQDPDATPEVVLVFEVVEGERSKYYRVRKRFGESAHLDWSHDGRTFGDDTRKAREVDEKLRTLLQWGVPAAGGSARGMPESFLAKVLMASQPEVTAILSTALAGDKDPSGKSRIMTALEAMMEDPLFRRVLGRAVHHVDFAYSSTGRPRQGKGSPWVDIRDKINDADVDVRRLQVLRDQSSAVAAKVRSLDDEVLALEEQARTVKRGAGDVEMRLTQQRELDQLEARLRAAEKELQSNLDKAAAVEQTKNAVSESEALVVARQSALDEARVQAVIAKRELETAEQALRQRQSEHVVRESELRLSRLKERQTQLQANIDTQVRLGERAQAAAKRHSELKFAQQRVEALNQEYDTRKNELQSLQTELATALEQRDKLRRVSRYQRYLGVVAQLEDAEAADREADTLRAQAEHERRRADDIESDLGKVSLPDHVQLGRLRVLHQDLVVQQAALDLGLTVVVTPDAPPLALEITVDDVVSTENLFAAARFAARESLILCVPGAKVSFTAAAAAAVQVLRATWKEQGEPVLRAAGVAKFEELEAAVGDAEDRREECRRLRTAANERDAMLVKSTLRASRLPVLRQSVQEERRAFDGLDLTYIEGEAAAFPNAIDLSRAESDADSLHGRLELEKSNAREQLQATAAQLEAARTQLASLEGAFRDATVLVEGNYVDAQNLVMATLIDLRARKTETDAELSEALTSDSKDIDAMENTLVVAQQAVLDATNAVDRAQANVHAAERDLTGNRTRLGMVEEIAKSVDLARDRREVGLLSNAFEQAKAAFPAGPMLTESDRIQAEARVEEANAVLSEKRTRCAESRGALMEVGGDVVEEELREAIAALELRKSEQRELEIEYGAWQLLQTTLREAEKAEATNLGKKLGGPLKTRFAELTGGRYSHVDVGADLRTEGFIAAGDLRSVLTLSAGTQEQLSTLFRLCLAEALKTAVVLDDHLSQTDSSKMQWFRDALEEIATKSQVIVISCWPQHYQPPPGRVDIAKKIDAAALVERY